MKLNMNRRIKMSVIKVEKLDKVFKNAESETKVLNNINLNIEKGNLFLLWEQVEVGNRPYYI